MIRISILLVVGALLCTPLTTYSATPAQLDTGQRDNSIENIDERVAILQDQVSILEKLFKSQLKISGYADVEYRSSSDPLEKTSFRLHHFSLFFKKQINEKWRFFSEIEYEDAPNIEFKDISTTCNDCSGKIFVEAMNIDYIWKPEGAIRFGRFFTPAGIWSIDHYPPFVTTQERPLHIRKIFPQLIDGAALFGNIPIGRSFLSYDFYIGNGEGNSGRKDLNSNKALGVKLNLNLPTLTYTEFGTTYYQETSNNQTEKTAIGFHNKLIIGDFTFQTEYAKSEFVPTSAPEYESEGYYAQFQYDYVKYVFGYRYDFFDELSTIPNGADIRNVFFINYRVDKDIVLKLEHIEKEPEDSSIEPTHFTIGSVAIYLGD